VAEAVGKGARAGRQNLRPMLALQAVIIVIVLLYYFCPATRPAFTQISAWQRAGGVLAAMVASGIGAGLLAQTSMVYFQNSGRWTWPHVRDALFGFTFYFFSGGIVFEFYRLQAYMFGDDPSLLVVLKKTAVDQFIYSVFWSTPTQSILFRWHNLHYSGRALWRELDGDFVIERMLPVLVTNWIFWIPVITLIYFLPLVLQMPLAIFATAIWVLLLSALSRQPGAKAGNPLPELVIPKIAE
jgi:hypothetical protein